MFFRPIVVVLVAALAFVCQARTVVVVPHPDDETIGIAGTIRQKVVAGEEVFVVVATHGEGSGVKNTLNGAAACGLCGRTHNPVNEGFLSQDLSGGLVTTEGFGNARLREFHAALDVLGVPTGNRNIYDYGDGKMTSATATDLLNLVVQQYGTDADYITVQGALDTTHKDHIALAEALAAYTGIAQGRKSYYRVYIYGTALPTAAGQKDISPYLAKKAEALGCYSLWDPASGRYKVGMHSVRTLITNAAASPNEFTSTQPSSVADWELY